MSASYGLRIICTASAEPSPFDGQWVAAYDPNRPGVDPNGVPLVAHLLVTSDPAQAMRFVDAKSAWTTWRQESDQRRADGKVSRPLTAFTVSVEELPQ
jgi:hypothetical protein